MQEDSRYISSLSDFMDALREFLGLVPYDSINNRMLREQRKSLKINFVEKEKKTKNKKPAVELDCAEPVKTLQFKIPKTKKSKTNKTKLKDSDLRV